MTYFILRAYTGTGVSQSQHKKKIGRGFGKNAAEWTGRVEISKETFRKIYVVERTNEAEIRLEEQSENTESCRENLWNEIQVKGP